MKREVLHDMLYKKLKALLEMRGSILAQITDQRTGELLDLGFINTHHCFKQLYKIGLSCLFLEMRGIIRGQS